VLVIEFMQFYFALEITKAIIYKNTFFQNRQLFKQLKIKI